jgi:RNA polymerase sigma factor, sigma-70 family
MEDSNLNVLTDEAIVKMAQEGSSTAEEYLIRKYMGIVKAKTKKYFIAGADSDDVIQEGMIGVFKAIRDYDPDSTASFATFVELCVSRQILSAVQSANRLKNKILNDYLPFSTDKKESEDGGFAIDKVPSGQDTDPETLTLIREIVDLLKANGSEIFSPMENKVWAEMLKGKNYREIAEALDRSPKSIDNAMQRIKRKISAYLEH